MLNKTGILLIHGFGGNTDEVKPFRDYLEARGYLVSCPELKGHNGIRADLGQSSYTDWLWSAESALIALKESCTEIVVIGFSMGGLIGLNLSIKHHLSALITLNSPIYYWDIPRILSNILLNIRENRTDYIKSYIKSSFKYPFSSMISFRHLLSQTKGMLHSVDCPLFVAQGLLDDTVQKRSADYIYNAVSSKTRQLKFYKNANHLICHSQDRDIVFGDVFDFIKHAN